MLALEGNSPHWGLNPGPSVYRTDALPLSYRGLLSHGPGTASPPPPTPGMHWRCGQDQMLLRKCTSWRPRPKIRSSTEVAHDFVCAPAEPAPPPPLLAAALACTLPRPENAQRNLLYAGNALRCWQSLRTVALPSKQPLHGQGRSKTVEFQQPA